MKVTIELTDDEIKESFQEKIENAIDYKFEGDDYNKMIDFVISKVDYKVDSFDAKKQVLADAMAQLLFKFGITNERVNLIEDGLFDVAGLASILNTEGKFIWIRNEEAEPLFDALEWYTEEHKGDIPRITQKVAKALDEEYFKKCMKIDKLPDSIKGLFK